MANQSLKKAASLQLLVRRYAEPKIKKYLFANNSRMPATVKQALQFKTGETLQETLGRFQFFQALLLEEFIDSSYTIPVTTFHDSVAFLPQVQLHFLESKVTASKAGRRRRQAQITFRLKVKDKTRFNVTTPEALILARKIKAQFSGFTFNKGKEKYTYFDQLNGYHLYYHTKSKNDAELLTKKILAIQGDRFDHTILAAHKSTKRTHSKPSVKVLGESASFGEYRPEAKVKFRYADLKVHGFSDVTLYAEEGPKRIDSLI